ncbi:MAG: secondary thiamine-phosphate synthase enzyme YjbQ [Nanobdellota archaeon]
MQSRIELKTGEREALYDITDEVERAVKGSSIEEGTANVYVRGATAAIMIQENWDESVQQDVIGLMKKLVPKGIWKHDQQDGNGDSHLKSGLIGPSETIPVKDNSLALSRWQNIFLCEFDGPREKREVLVTITPA